MHISKNAAIYSVVVLFLVIAACDSSFNAPLSPFIRENLDAAGNNDPPPPPPPYPDPVAGDQKTITVNSIQFNLRYAPATPAGGFQRDAVAANRTYITRGYWMGETEVTQELYQAVMGVNPSYYIADKRPVEMVRWYDTLVFCNKLSVAAGKTAVYIISGSKDPAVWGTVPTSSDATWDAVTMDAGANGYRLPTEMEWMWAAMGAGDGDTGYTKPFAGSNGSNVIEDYAWYSPNTDRHHEVGKKLPNELGLFDMSGNVWEWCWDWNAGYGTGDMTDDSGPATPPPPPPGRIRRGGSGSYTASYCAVARRSGEEPFGTHRYVGFRVVYP